MKKTFYACAIALSLCYQAVLAQPILVLKGNDSNRAVSPHAFVYAGRASRADFETVLLADSSQFLQNPLSHEIDYGVDDTGRWCVFQVRNETDEENWILKIQHSRVDTAQLYLVRSNNTSTQFPIIGHFQRLSERSIRSLPFAFALSIKKNETVRCYLYTERQFGRHAAIAHLQTEAEFENYEYGFSIALGFVSGMVVLAAFVGFFLFIFIRQKLYIYYSIYALSFLFVLLADTGFAHAALFFPLDPTVVNGFTMIFYYWMGGCLGIFTIELLQLKQHAKPWLYWLGAIMSYAFCVIALLLLIPGLPYFLRWAFISSSYYLAFTVNVYILFILSISVVKKEPIVYFYTAGFYFTSIIALLLTLSDFHVFQFPFENKDVFFLTPLVEILCVALGIGIHFSRTLKERIEVQLALTQTQDQIITIQEDERKRIAQDLHDDVGNSLAAVRNMVVQKKDAAEVEKEISNVIQTIRTISHNLMPVDFEEFSLHDILSNVIGKFKDHATISIELECSGAMRKMSPTTELVIYRIVNELITNTLKHARATRALVQLLYQQESLVVTVEDNGVGIPGKTHQNEGIGLKNIRSRAAYIQASLNIESDHKGTLVILEIPYSHG